ncbi:MAG: asparagine synthase (glutamine-hydrolyzing) [Candidatus Rokubacteria bacterium 13_1_40CM_69_27]|nr:MAG: asparagine synthase (glutamine-hydrolyzing) [Candidatus Rokubacteria bacterium 13_1_40CM_69_27]OLC35736.1 MAG: asparagine synthase (glutamine-hydrolyzing) [Candidatus Rokubacteria bacterium 13_1_40CM_4_69_5]
MCGIAGFLVRDRPEHEWPIVRRMTDSLRHRGPDEEGFYLDEDVALGIRRLRVIDLQTGRQPMSNEDGTVWVMQNGEIYNFADLRARLERLGHHFRTRSDTEAIAHAYEEYGDDCVRHLDGMFAFALWDATERRLVLARDRMGEKPLYYSTGADAFVFGSELRALLEHPAVPRQLSFESLSRYLAFDYVPAPHSILAGIAKLPPGHLLTAAPGSKPRVVRYWDLPFSADHSLDEHEWAERLRTQLETSVRRQLVSDVPLGMFLSGGIDSSAIVTVAARLNDTRPLRTFSVGFAERSYDERPFARAVAQQCGTDHEEVVFSPDDMLGLLEDVGGLLDEPLVDTSFLPLYVLSRLARRSVTVVLSGDGGDELFCGYPTFLAERGARWVRHLPGWLQRWTTYAVNRLPPSSRYGSVEFLLKQFFRGLPYAPEIRTQLLLGGLTVLEQSGLFSAGVRAACAGSDPYEELATAVADVPGLHPVDRLIYQHCKFYLADQNLATVDRASMACGLEVRAPFLDRALVELAGQIPSSLKLRGWETKYILKRALCGALPQAVLARRKQGFGVPIGAWLRGPLRPALEDRLAPGRVRRIGLFDPTAVRHLVAAHLGGSSDHRKILWALMMFDAWRERYLPCARWS